MGKKHQAYNEGCSDRCNLATCPDIKRSRDIDLSGCNLDAVPKELLGATNARSINLSNNNITKIENLDNAINLEYLNLGVNKISKIEGLDTLVNLKTLRLYSNSIDKVCGLESLVNIECLDLRYNDIEWIEGFNNMEKATKIAMDGNPLRSVQERRLVDLGFEFGDVGVKLREEEIARDLVDYSKGKMYQTLLDKLAEDVRRSLVKNINAVVGV